MFEVYCYGALRVLVDSSTGLVAATQCRISGEAAALRFSPDYIAKAEQFAINAYESQYSEV